MCSGFPSSNSTTGNNGRCDHTPSPITIEKSMENDKMEKKLKKLKEKNHPTDVHFSTSEYKRKIHQQIAHAMNTVEVNEGIDTAQTNCIDTGPQQLVANKQRPRSITENENMVYSNSHKTNLEEQEQYDEARSLKVIPMNPGPSTSGYKKEDTGIQSSYKCGRNGRPSSKNKNKILVPFVTNKEMDSEESETDTQKSWQMDYMESIPSTSNNQSQAKEINFQDKWSYEQLLPMTRDIDANTDGESTDTDITVFQLQECLLEMYADKDSVNPKNSRPEIPDLSSISIASSVPSVILIKKALDKKKK
ncbi:hypothetical protein C0J52_25400 [Blattella germanica]|nr:hypothetical protein C0J52_25400 [Blattella germanica]